jgi:hypothetical protein
LIEYLAGVFQHGTPLWVGRIRPVSLCADGHVEIRSPRGLEPGDNLIGIGGVSNHKRLAGARIDLFSVNEFSYVVGILV